MCKLCTNEFIGMDTKCRKEVGNDAYKKWASTAGAAVFGAFIPTAFFSAIGIGAAGPIAGGWFAANMGAGLAAGGWMAGL